MQSCASRSRGRFGSACASKYPGDVMIAARVLADPQASLILRGSRQTKPGTELLGHDVDETLVAQKVDLDVGETRRRNAADMRGSRGETRTRARYGEAQEPAGSIGAVRRGHRALRARRRARPKARRAGARPPLRPRCASYAAGSLTTTDSEGAPRSGRGRGGRRGARRPRREVEPSGRCTGASGQGGQVVGHRVAEASDAFRFRRLFRDVRGA